MRVERPAGEREQFERSAAVVAHELNNLLTVVRTYTYFARGAVSSEQRVRDLRVVAAAAERGAALTDWLSLLSERSPRAQDQQSAALFVSNAVIRLQQLTLDGTVISASRSSDDVWFRANALRLEHVIVSLVLTANQTLRGGCFEFEVQQRLVADGSELELAAGPYVVIAISCRAATPASPLGGGLSVLERMAAPLGPLTELVRSMNGTLALAGANADQAGFELYLPLGTSQPSETRSRSSVAKGQVILVVEDDNAIRFALQRTLSGAGYVVLEAGDAAAAKQILVSADPCVTLVVSDVMLPQGGGPALFAWLKAERAAVGLLLTSGREREAEALAASVNAQFLGKPFYPTELLAAVRRAVISLPLAIDRSASATRLVVLVVDDDADIRDSLQRLLSECDFEAVCAATGPEALQILGARRVDAIVSDQLMPGLDGIELLAQVAERFPRCTRILCTSHPASDAVTSAVGQGRVEHVLAKTMHAVALREELERAILAGSRRATSE
jgi:two-component system cell cycle response regulator